VNSLHTGRSGRPPVGGCSNLGLLRDLQRSKIVEADATQNAMCYEEEERRSTARAPAVSELGRPRDIGASTYGLTCIKTMTFAAPTVVRKTGDWRRRALVASRRD
jgi:hypothetical protein